jgi:hypothetical protein
MKPDLEKLFEERADKIIEIVAQAPDDQVNAFYDALKAEVSSSEQLPLAKSSKHDSHRVSAWSPDVSVLAVGEFESDRQLLCEVIHDCGWRLIEARDRKAVLEHLDHERIHVVIASCETLGWTWKQLLRILSARACPPQLIVTSRTCDDHLWSEVLNCGGYDVLPQPLRRDEVERVIASARRHYEPRVPSALILPNVGTKLA